MNRIRFGPGGNSQSFYKDNPKKSSLEACRWLFAKGLDAYEYECTRGVKISKEFAVKLGKEAKACDVALSLHAPYYINLAAINPEKQQASMNHLLKSLEAANWMGGTQRRRGIPGKRHWNGQKPYLRRLLNKQHN